jgi:ABC-type transporter Mla MlaB component
MNAALNTSSWTTPAILNHTTWQTAKADCLLAIQTAMQSNSDTVTHVFNINWQACTVIDSSALVFILFLKKRFTTLIIYHQHIPVALKQLAQLYEVTDIVAV